MAESPAAESSLNKTLFVPAFRIRLDGRDAAPQVIADVLEVSFTDDLENIDSFEFVLYDWDSAQLQPRYSSPWDDNGQLLRIAGTTTPVPVFEPGVKISLYMGYLEDGDPELIMEGEIVSLTPSFPASGAPTCRVRALDAFQRNMQKIEVIGNFSGTQKAIVNQICTQNGINVNWSTLEEEGSEAEGEAIEGTLYDEVKKRADAYGLSMITERSETSPTRLFLSAPAAENQTPVTTFTWGQNLISFTPVLSAKGQVAEVVVRSAHPDADDAGAILSSKRWSDINLSPTALGPIGTGDPEAMARGIREVIKPDDVHTQQDADRAALAHLTDLAKALITGSGTSIGLPELRAGQLIELRGLGARFDGRWRLTQTTHTIGGSGYSTSFQARKEVLDG